MNARLLLRPLSALYAALQRLDAARRDRSSVRPSLPVVSVGNLSTGGTGKTPLCIYLIERLQAERPCLLLSRGYGRERGDDLLWTAGSPLPDPRVMGDEPALIARSIRNGAVAVSGRRADYLMRIEHEFPDAVVILDDGFQHRQIGRDCDIVIIDADTAARPVTLPEGVLRETPDGLKRATVVLAVCDEAERFARRWASDAAEIFRMEFRAGEITPWTSGAAGTDPVPMPAMLVTGIARPERLRDALRDRGIEPVAWLNYRDHYRYGPSDVAAISDAMRESGARSIITTSKDAVKLGEYDRIAERLFVSEVKPVIDREERFLELVRSSIASIRSRR